MNAPGSEDAHAFANDLGGGSAPRDVLEQSVPLDAWTYLTTAKFRRKLDVWWRAFKRRTELAGGRCVGGGAAGETQHETLAVVYAVNALFVAKIRVRWAHFFVLTTRRAGADFETEVRARIAAGAPFLVQRLGRFGCIVPTLPARIDADERRRIERELGVHARHYVAGDVDAEPGDYGEDTDDDDEAAASAEVRQQGRLRRLELGAVLYDTADVVDALVVWARFTADVFRGRVPFLPNVRMGPLLEYLLSGGDVVDDDDAAQ